MVVKSLSHELQGQPVLVAAGLFDLGPLILEPDFNLGLVQVEFLRQRLSPLLRYVPVGLKLGFQSLQLLGRERRPRPLVLLAVLLLFQFPCPRPWCGNNSGNEMFIYRLGDAPPPRARRQICHQFNLESFKKHFSITCFHYILCNGLKVAYLFPHILMADN